MKIAKKLTVIFVRPLYRIFLEGPLWRFLSRVKAYFFAEIGGQLADIGSFLAHVGVHIAGMERQLEENRRTIEERLRALEQSNAAQWNAIEQLLLAIYRQPEGQTAETPLAASPAHLSNAAEPNRTYAASNLR